MSSNYNLESLRAEFWTDRAQEAQKEKEFNMAKMGGVGNPNIKIKHPSIPTVDCTDLPYFDGDRDGKIAERLEETIASKSEPARELFEKIVVAAAVTRHYKKMMDKGEYPQRQFDVCEIDMDLNKIAELNGKEIKKGPKAPSPQKIMESCKEYLDIVNGASVYPAEETNREYIFDANYSICENMVRFHLNPVFSRYFSRIVKNKGYQIPHQAE
ncbi:MAG: hypothetical protein ACOYB8_11740 [Eubacteriaceae bacterium]|jgi:hypothetical protein